MKIKDVPVIGPLLALSLFMVMGCSQIVNSPKYELSLEALAQANELGSMASQLDGLGMIETPDREWFMSVEAYYLALSVAWAHGDEEDVEYFSGKIADLYNELIEDEDFPVPGQEL